MDLIPVKLTISMNQFDKLRRGHMIQINKNGVANGKYTFYVNSTLAKKIAKAKKKEKGIRIQLSKHEVERSAEGLKDFLKKAKNFYTKHVKKHAAPLLKKGVQDLANAALTEAEILAPQVAPLLEKGRQYIPKLTEKVGAVTGAYGMIQNMGGIPVLHCGGCMECGGACTSAGSFRPAGYP